MSKLPRGGIWLRSARAVAQNDVEVALQVLARRPGRVRLDVLHDLVVHACVKLGVRVGQRTRVALVDVLDLGSTHTSEDPRARIWIWMWIHMVQGKHPNDASRDQPSKK